MQLDGIYPRRIFYTDFTTAGQDAITVVAYLVYFMESAKLKH